MSARKRASKKDELEALKTKFKDLLKGESDRGLALVGHAYLDDALDEFLHAYFLDDPEVVRQLLRQGGPIGSFKTRCDLAYALGLLGPDMFSDLDQIREIRNEFAHRYSSLDFSTSPAFDRCQNLKIPNLNDPEKKWAPRDRFIMAVSLLASHFLSQMKKTPHREVGKDFRVQIDSFPISFVVAGKDAPAD